MTALNYARQKIIGIAKESFFNERVNSFWNAFATATNQVVGKWDGRDSFILKLPVPLSTELEVHTYSLSQAIKVKIQKRFDELTDILEDELIELRDVQKEQNRVHRILSILNQTEEEIKYLNIDEKYKSLLKENFIFNRQMFEQNFEKFIKLDSVIAARNLGFVYLNFAKGYEEFKSFHQALKKGGLISDAINVRQLASIFNNEGIGKIEWKGDPKETDCFFKALKKNSNVKVIGGIWKAVEQNFIVRDTKGNTISSAKMRSLDVFKDNNREDKERKREILSIVDLL